MCHPLAAPLGRQTSTKDGRMANYYRLAKVGVFGVLLSGVSAGLLAVPVRLSAQEPDAPKAPQTAPPKAKKPAGKPIIKDEFGNPLAELKPKKDETPEQKKHAEALALFMSVKRLWSALSLPDMKS